MFRDSIETLTTITDLQSLSTFKNKKFIQKRIKLVQNEIEKLWKRKQLEYFTKLVKDSTEFFILASWPPQVKYDQKFEAWSQFASNFCSLFLCTDIELFSV